MHRVLVVAALLGTSCVSMSRYADAPTLSRRALQVGIVEAGDMPLHISAHGVVLTDLSPVVEAVIFVSEGQSPLLHIGQTAEMRAYGRSARGQLVRMDSESKLPRTIAVARFGRDAPVNNPDSSVEIVIDAGVQQNTLYVARPAGARADSDGVLWRLHRDGRRASRVVVRYGHVVGPLAEVVEGLKAGDHIILSDLSRWSEQSSLRISP